MMTDRNNAWEVKMWKSQFIIAFLLAFVSAACASSGVGTQSNNASDVEGKDGLAGLWSLDEVGQAQGSVDNRVGRSYADVWMGAQKETRSDAVERYIYYCAGASGDFGDLDFAEWSEEEPKETLEPREPRNPARARAIRDRRQF